MTREEYYALEQGSEEWFQARLGKVTGSRITDVMNKGAGRRAYMTQLVQERLLGKPHKIPETHAMRRGKELEPFARVEYEVREKHRVTTVGFAPHPEIEMSGASPDGLIGKNGNLEIKCPLHHNHIDKLLTKSVAWDHRLQMQFTMACTGAKWCDYVVYDPDWPPALQIIVIRVRRDKALVYDIEKSVRKFLAETDELEKELRKRMEET